MRALRFLLSILVALLAQASAFGSEGAVQLRKQAGPLLITVFGSPAPPSAGPVEISLFIQDRNTLESVSDADVSLILRAEASGTQIRAKATPQQARNKLRYAAPVNLAESGKWRIDVTARRRGPCTETDGVIEVAPTPTLLMSISYWGYVAFLPLLIGAVVVHGWLIPQKR